MKTHDYGVPMKRHEIGDEYEMENGHYAHMAAYGNVIRIDDPPTIQTRDLEADQPKKYRTRDLKAK